MVVLVVLVLTVVLVLMVVLSKEIRRGAYTTVRNV